MNKSKYAHIADVDIHTLETIYADGRAMGRLLQDFKDDLAKARAENADLKTELRTAAFKLKIVTDLYEKAVGDKKDLTTPRGLPDHIRGTNRKRPALRTSGVLPLRTQPHASHAAQI